MLSKLILLLGLAAATLVAWFCTQEKSPQLQKLSETTTQQNIPTHAAVSQEREEQESTAVQALPTPESESESTMQAQQELTEREENASQPETAQTETTSSETQAEEVTVPEETEETAAITSTETTPAEEESNMTEATQETAVPATSEPSEESSESNQTSATSESGATATEVVQPSDTSEVSSETPSSEAETASENRPSETVVQQEESPEETEAELVDLQQKNIETTQTQIDELLKEQPIYFKSGSSELTLDSKKLLDRIIDLVNKNSVEIARLRVAGHTDASGPAAYNKRLSQQRAEAVRDYLIEHKIKVPSIEAIGYGEERPVSENPYAKENRRVEITVQKGE